MVQGLGFWDLGLSAAKKGVIRAVGICPEQHKVLRRVSFYRKEAPGFRV